MPAEQVVAEKLTDVVPAETAVGACEYLWAASLLQVDLSLASCAVDS